MACGTTHTMICVADNSFCAAARRSGRLRVRPSRTSGWGRRSRRSPASGLSHFTSVKGLEAEKLTSI
eukprot:4750363-Prymnesium_polylepis.1